MPVYKEEREKMNTALLTIDDFSAKNTPAIVDCLNEKGIKAIFFATGVNVEKFYEEAVYAVKNGMIIGNHSYSHPAFSAVTMEECIEEIEKCEQVLDKLYKDSGVERVYKPFRFPYGDKGGDHKDALQKYFRENGFHKVDDTHITYSWWKEFGLDTDVDTFWTFDFEEYKIWQDPEFTKESVWKKMHEQNPALGEALFNTDFRLTHAHLRVSFAPSLCQSSSPYLRVRFRMPSLIWHKIHPASAHVLDENQYKENNRHFILMHNFDETEEVFPEYYKVLVEHLLENGLVFDEPKFLLS